MFQIAVEIRNAKLVRQGLEDLGRQIPRIGRNQIYQALLRVRRRLAAEPSPPTPGSFKFVSDRQRRFVLRAIRLGLIEVPRRRTGLYTRGWTIRRNELGWDLFNRAPHAVWVSGDVEGLVQQANIHQNRWEELRDALGDEIETLPDDIASEIELIDISRGLG